MNRLAAELIPPRARVLAVGTAAETLPASADERSVKRSDAEALDALVDERFEVVYLGEILEHVVDPADLLRRVQPLLADEGAVVASVRNATYAEVRRAVLAGRLDGLLTGGARRLFTRESIEDLFEGSGYVITHWERERAEIPPAAEHRSARELLDADPESSTSQFTVRAVPSTSAAQLAAAHAELRELRNELEGLRASAAQTTGLEEELETLRRAHDERGRRLVAERLEFANELGELQRHLEAMHRSRSFRYTAPLRSFFGILRGRR